MPKALEDALKREASRKGLSGDRADAYVYGTMRKAGWKPQREINAAHARRETSDRVRRNAPGGRTK